MKKRTRNFMSGGLALALAGVIAFSGIAPATVQAEGTEPTTRKVSDAGNDGVINYVSVGASQTNGYGLQGYLPITVNDGRVPDEQLPMLLGLMNGTISKNDLNVYGYQRAPEGAYPDLVRDALEAEGYTVNLDQLAISSMRAEEVRMLLDNSYYGDSYTEWRFYDENGNGWFSSAAKEEGMTNAQALAALRKEYQSSLAEADLITYDVGVNNFGVYAINRIDSGLDDPSKAKYEADFSKILQGEDLEKYYAMREEIETMLMGYAGEANDEGDATLQYMADTFAYALIGFCVNFDKSMEIIHEMNPDATIVVVSIQNLLDGMSAKIPGLEGEMPLDGIYGTVVDMANLYISNYSPYADYYYFAEAGDVSLFLDDILAYDGNPDSLNQDMRDCFGLYDNSLFGWELMVRYNQFKDYPDEVVSAGVDAAYDALATIAQICAQQDVLDFGALDTLDSGEDALEDMIEEALFGAMEAGMQGKEYKLDTSVLEDPDNANAMAIGIRFNIGNSFFAHPNREGHAQRAAAILNCIETESDDEIVMFDFILEKLTIVGDLIDGYLAPATRGEYGYSEDSYYVAIGDSTTVGKQKKNKFEDTYEEKLADALYKEYGVKEGKNYALKGFRVEELRAVLDETYEPDAYGAAFDTSAAKGLVEEIEKADLITISLGNENFSTFVTSQIQASMNGKGYEFDWERYLGEEGVADVAEFRAQVRATLIEQGVSEEPMALLPGKEVNLVDLITDILETYAYGLAGFATNFPVVLDEIHEINPDAEVVIVGMFNPIDDAVYGDMALGAYIDYFVTLSNRMFAAYAYATPHTTFVPVEETTTDADGSTEMPSYILALTGLLPYLYDYNQYLPNNAGHEYIKTQILNALTIKKGNLWTEDFVMDGWTYGEDANVPTAKAKFGEVSFAYYADAACKNALSSAPTEPGTYYVKASVAETEEYFGLEEVIAYTISDTTDVYQIWGKNRYKTSIGAAEQIKTEMGISKFRTVIVATGDNFADALSGSYLAYVKSAPIILVNEGTAAMVTDYINDNLVENGQVYVLGGTGAVADEWIAGLDTENIKRLKGKSRFDTNIAILEEAGVTSGEILVCTGATFADSLSASAAKKPIFLINGDTLKDEQKAYLEGLTDDSYCIIGGEAAVSATMADVIAGYGDVERVKGANRFATSVAVAERFVEDPEAVVIAHGGNFPDGLCGGLLAIAADGPIILSSDTKATLAKEYVADNGITYGYVLGGGGCFTDNTIASIFDIEADEIHKMRVAD